VIRNFELSQLLKLEGQLVFNEIANFENYVNFIPGCSKATLREKNEVYEIGELDLIFY
jgi:Oligoketide cyclase/lipid transport protein